MSTAIKMLNIVSIYDFVRMLWYRYNEARVYIAGISVRKKYSIQLKRPCDIFKWRIGNKLLVTYACYDVLIN